MSFPKIPALLTMLALFLAPIFGGHIPLDMSQEQGLSPNTTHLLIALPILVAIVLLAVRENVVMIPAPRILIPLVLFWIVLFASAIGTQFRHESLVELCKWTVYCAACFVCVASLGRTDGPKLALFAWVAGCAITAVLGIWEFVQNVATTPNWRIFAGWQNPNAAAGMLSIGLPVGIALAMSHYRNRSVAIALSVASAFIFVALWLTASKGGLLSAGAGVFVFGLILVFQRRARPALVGWPSLVLIAFAAAALLALLYAPSSGTDAGGPSRVFAAETESAQSVGFRAALWRDTAKMATANPLLGVGIGAFGLMFPRYTVTQGSAVAHNSYLQLASEIGFIGIALVVVFVGAWLFAVFRSNPGIPDDSNALRIGILGSIFAAGANAMVESSFSYFGFGLSVFALLGIGLLLAADGARPERSPLGSRALPAIVLSAFVGVYLGITAINDQKVISASELMRSGDYEGALKGFREATVQPFDATPKVALVKLLLAKGIALENANRAPEAEQARQEALRSIQDAVHLRPNATTYAVFADTLAALRFNSQAESQYGRAIALSPSNPLYRLKQFRFLVSINDPDRAEIAARDLIKMEETRFFTIRALPWLVNLDTIEARMFLAQRAKESGDIVTEIETLEGAYRILLEYHQRTYAELMRLTGGDESLFDVELAGQSMREAIRRFEELRSVAERLQSLYKAENRDEDARRIEQQMKELSGN